MLDMYICYRYGGYVFMYIKTIENVNSVSLYKEDKINNLILIKRFCINSKASVHHAVCVEIDKLNK